MANKLKANKALVQDAVKCLFGSDVEIEWADGKHPVGTFYVCSKKFTYAVDSTNKGDYTFDKTKSKLAAALTVKALQWGYINDPSEFKTKFTKKEKS